MICPVCKKEITEHTSGELERCNPLAKGMLAISEHRLKLIQDSLKLFEEAERLARTMKEVAK